MFQTQRLENCERMLVAIELAGWLNETNMALQAVVQCYGLLAPVIHYKIPSIPVVQVSDVARFCSDCFSNFCFMMFYNIL